MDGERERYITTEEHLERLLQRERQLKEEIDRRKMANELAREIDRGRYSINPLN